MPAPAFYPRLLPSLTLKLSVLTALLLTQTLITLPHTTGKASPSTRPHTILSSTIDPATRSRISEAYGKTRLSFQANHGQSDPKVKFLARGGACNLFLTPTEAAMTLRIANRTRRNADSHGANYTPPVSQSAYIKMRLVGANTAPELSGLDPLPGACNYFIGAGAEKWRTDVPQYARVKYGDVYRGIDMIFYGNQSDLEYDFKVAPGADPAAIKVSFESPLSVDENGDLIIDTASGPLRQRKPFAYQEADGAKHQVAAQYILKGNGVGFRMGAYDKSRPLIIDPVLSYSTYLGASGSETGWAITVDSAGAAYIAGQTNSSNFPTTQDAFQKSLAGASDVFVIKLNPAGNALVYSTYIGGASDDFGFGIAVDATGNAYVTGQTSSSNFPTKPTIPFLDSTSAFILKLNPAGNALVYSTLLGGIGVDTGKAIAVDSKGAVYVTGETVAQDFPVFNAFQSQYKGGLCIFDDFGIPCTDAFVSKLNPEGTALVYSTYLGGNGTDTGTGIAVDSAGAAYVTGQTAATDFPTTPGAFQTQAGGSSTGRGFGGDAFVTKLAPSGSSLIYSTYLGGGGDDRGSGIAVDSEGSAYIGGTTNSFNFPTTSGAYQPSNGGSPAYKSTTGGSSFSAIKNGLAANNVRALAIDPVNPSTIYAGITPASTSNSFSFAGGVFKSTDGGNSWTATGNSLNLGPVNALAIDPDVPATVYAGTSQGVFKSTDGGNTWIARNQGIPFIPVVNALVIDPKRPSTIYIGTGVIFLPFGFASGGIFKSTDGGATWEPTNFNRKPDNILVFSLAFDPRKTQILYAGTNDGFYLGSKGGKKWKGPTLTEIQPSFNAGGITSIAVDPNDRFTLYAAFGSNTPFPPVNSGFFKSTDRGFTWARLVSGSNVAIAKTIAVDPRNSSIIYAGGHSLVTSIFNNPPSGALLKSTNGGQSWSTTELSDAPVNAVVIDPQNSAVYAGAFIGSDAFITKLNPTGSALVYSTHLGDRGADLGFAVAIDSAGVAYVTGHTVSDRFPTVNAFQPTKGRQDSIGDAFVAAVNRDGSALVYSSYLGSNGIDESFAIAVDSTGAAYVTGRNNSINFPTVNPLQAALFGSVFDAFVTRVSPAESP